MSDFFNLESSGVSGPATRLAAITPSNSAAILGGTRALYIGGSGNVSVISAAGETVTFSNVQSGSILPVRVTHVRSTGTTATLIIGMR